MISNVLPFVLKDRKMNDREQRKQAKLFSQYWSDDKLGGEKQDTLPFWFQLLSQVFGVDSPSSYMQCEVPVPGTGFIDGLILDTKVLIEQKSRGIALNKLIKQSDGSDLTPCEQAKRYANCLPHSQKPRWIVTCNFDEFWVYDQEKPNDQPVVVELKNLERDYQKLSFLVDERINEIAREEALSIQAGELVGRIYELIRAQYSDKTPEAEVDRSLNILCVRLVFCLYAEDAGLFGGIHKFHDFLKYTPVGHVREALINLFKMLDTKEADRDPYEDETLLSFPYVNGGLFTDSIIIPRLTQEIIDLLINDASSGFDWKDISPTIFGSVFESTLNPETRRKGGMHYTSVQNIHKVIDPLFMNELREEFNQIVAINTETTKMKRLKAFTEKLGSLTFLDPACGSGNFLTETFLSLRKLENDALRILTKGQGALFFTEDMTPINVGIHQFYGIEINDFAVTVAKTALWIAENQMMQRTEDIVQKDLDFLPLKSYPNIVEGNALRMDWNDVVPKEKLNYIMGNPPFIGARMMGEVQKRELLDVFEGFNNAGNLDYVACWFKKAVDFMQNSRIHSAFVATNSISQGELVATLWKPIFDAQKIELIFAWRPFVWDSEANDKAHVHVVIIGFSCSGEAVTKHLFEDDMDVVVSNINGYLVEGETVFIENRRFPISEVTPSTYGSFALDDGHFTITGQEYDSIVSAEPATAKLLRPFIGARELMHNDRRYCVWLCDTKPSDIQKSKIVMDKVKKVQAWRATSNRKNTVELAKTPTLFAEIRQPKTEYLAIPTVCSEKRTYLPIKTLSPDVIASNQIYVISNATNYEFGILTSLVHMAWMRAVAGRLEMRYRYSNKVVYNNFVWPEPTEELKERINTTAQEILNVRALYPDCSLADLYDDLTMPVELRKAHKANDKAVMEAYGFSSDMTEEDIVAELFKLYEKKVKEVEEAELKAKEEEKARKKAEAAARRAAKKAAKGS